jgi:hypothetical protein
MEREAGLGGGVALAAINLVAGLVFVLLERPAMAILLLAIAGTPLLLGSALRARPAKARSSTRA